MTHLVEIKTAGNLIEVLGVSPETLHNDLSYYHRERNSDPRAKRRYKSTLKRLYEVTSNGSLIIPAGFTSRVCRKLKSLGIGYKIKDLTPDQAKLPEPDWTALRHIELRKRQDELLATLSVAKRGVVEAPPGYGKGFIAACVCRVYPTVPIIVASPRVPIVNQTYRAILDVANDVGIIGGGNQCPDRITVCTMQSLERADLDRCGIFMFDECHHAAADKVSSVIAKVKNARMFGFSATPRGRSDGAEPRMEALFGPIIFRMPYEEAAKAGIVVPIRVVAYEVEGSPVTQITPVARKRWGLWRNNRRNSAIARAARQFGDDTQVLIIVETLEHAIYLKALLPEFEMVYSTKDKNRISQIQRSGHASLREIAVPGLSAKERDVLANRFRSGELKKVIATGVWNQGVDFPSLQILIRAEGLTGNIPSVQIPGRVSRIDGNKKFGMVIDFVDRFDQKFYDRSKRRMSWYGKQGWQVEVRTELPS